MLKDYQTANIRQQSGVAEIAVGDTEDKGGDRVMQLADFMQEKMLTHNRRPSEKKNVTETLSKNEKAEPSVLEMTLHVPCCVAGRTASGSRWKGKTKTVSLNIFGAHLLLPEDVDLEGEISMVFHIPSALKVLFNKHVFRVKAEIRHPDIDVHWPTPSGEKVVCVAFSHPLRFASWAVKGL